MRRPALVATLACACLASPAGAQLFKCKMADGKTVYQDSKCEETAKSSVLQTSPATPSPAAGDSVTSADCSAEYLPKVEQDPKTGELTPANRKARNELELMLDLTVNYEGCAGQVPGFATKFGDAYSAFRRKFHDVVARYEANPAAKRVAACRKEQEAIRARGYTQPHRQDRDAQCMQVVGPVIEKLNREGMPR